MNQLNKVLHRLPLALVGMCAVMSGGVAYAWPDAPIRIVVPFSPGGTTDFLGRLAAEGLRQQLNSDVIVENKAGAGGNLGASEVARAKPDGYTLLLGTPGTQIVNQLVYKNTGYDAQADFAPVAYIAEVPNVVLSNPGTGLKNMADLIKRAKQDPTALNWGSPGVGSTGHLALELLLQKTGISINHIPYKGASQATNDLLGGQIQLSGDNLPTALSFIKSGKLNALGVTSSTKAASAPDIPTVAQTVPGYELTSWFVLMAPARTPPTVIDTLNRAVNKWLQLPETQKRLADQAARPMGGTAAKLADHLAAEKTKYETLVKNAGIQAK
ncbi:Bug family tripartite tricarboxylate transporter substrate binding protein [Advenella kashmirensis]